MTLSEARKLVRAFRGKGPGGLELSAEVRKVAEPRKGRPAELGYQLVFVGGVYGEHGINVHCSDRERALIHWRGYCEVNKAEPVDVSGTGLSRDTADRICSALSPVRGWVRQGSVRAWAQLEGARIIVRATLTRNPTDRGPRELTWTEAEVWFAGMTESEVADAVEAALESAGGRVVRKGVRGSYTAATHYDVVVLEVTPRRAFIRGRYRYGDTFERWVQKWEVRVTSPSAQKTDQVSAG